MKPKEKVTQYNQYNNIFIILKNRIRAKTYKRL